MKNMFQTQALVSAKEEAQHQLATPRRGRWELPPEEEKLRAQIQERLVPLEVARKIAREGRVLLKEAVCLRYSDDTPCMEAIFNRQNKRLRRAVAANVKNEGLQKRIFRTGDEELLKALCYNRYLCPELVNFFWLLRKKDWSGRTYLVSLHWVKLNPENRAEAISKGSYFRNLAWGNQHETLDLTQDEKIALVMNRKTPPELRIRFADELLK